MFNTISKWLYYSNFLNAFNPFIEVRRVRNKNKKCIIIDKINKDLFLKCCDWMILLYTYLSHMPQINSESMWVIGSNSIIHSVFYNKILCHIKLIELVPMIDMCNHNQISILFCCLFRELAISNKNIKFIVLFKQKETKIRK